MPRATTAYVSAFQRDRLHQAQFRRRESRRITADLTAVLPAGVTVTSVTWRTTSPWTLRMSDGQIDGAKVSVRADFQYAGCAGLKAQVTLSDGDVLNQAFLFTVQDAPFFYDELGPMTSGPYTLTTTAP
ncbi:hypothetical protein CSC62_05425 [Pseudoxanthomonas jiangsuensis]|uniref:hypothetical protein n=1 Tax=Pseudoxanthomonas jiangsuensis TaxID=619688 RepID=UPI001391E49C|nr:hypothetical protein [Pseudoxanthomonas jiangsuensis]KAF1698350.1 hypothetical protein CSC62_05425 [Pseudoxanthomonas jiangsuensis]